MKIALAQINFHIGNFADNENKIIRFIQKSEKQNVDIVVFPELSITGYPPRDFLEFNDFIDKSEEALDRIANYCQNTAAIVGAPSRNKTGKGKPLFNSACFLYKGKAEQIFHKTLLPTYDIFDEYRYFEPNKEFKLLDFKGSKIAVTILDFPAQQLDEYIKTFYEGFTSFVKRYPDIKKVYREKMMFGWFDFGFSFCPTKIC